MGLVKKKKKIIDCLVDSSCFSLKALVFMLYMVGESPPVFITIMSGQSGEKWGKSHIYPFEKA